MEHRTLGTQGLGVAEIGLGCMGMSEFYGPTNDEESIATIHAALDQGVTLIDTADMYGPFINEELVGKAIRDRREQVILATKFGIQRITNPDGTPARTINGRPEYVLAAAEASLQRLGVDHIDLYYQHRVDPNVPIEETVGAMAKLVEAGKVRYLGLSEAGAETIRRAYTVHPISAVQSEFSLWSRDIEESILPTLRELGIGLVAYSPLGRGFLTGQIRSFDDLDADDYRRFSPRFQGENFTKNLELVQAVEALASAKGVTASQLALAWVLAQGNEIVPIPGTKRRTYLAENLAAAQIRLSEADLAQLDAILPVGAAAGTRYPQEMMQAIGR